MTDHAVSGRWDGLTHILPLRVYYADTDAGGVVYHATYLSFAERARTEMTRLMGLDQVKLRDEKDLLFAVRSCEIDFLRPARLDDPLTVRSTLTHLGGASLHVCQTVSRNGEDLVRLVVRLVCMTTAAKAARIPEELRIAFHSYLTQGTE